MPPWNVSRHTMEVTRIHGLHTGGRIYARRCFPRDGIIDLVESRRQCSPKGV